MTNRILFFVALFAVAILPCTAQTDMQIKRVEAVHVATALNHLTVFEFGESVVSAATGSTSFQIEWKDNKLFVKPLRLGASTDLFVWTATQRFEYELDPPGEVKDMNFVIDNPAPSATRQSEPAVQAQVDAATEFALSGALMDLVSVDHGNIKSAKRGVTVRIESVLQTKAAFYIRYSILNLGKRPYRVTTPSITRIVADHPGLSLIRLRGSQLTASQTRKLGPTERSPIVVVSGAARATDLKPGEETQGVVALPGMTTAGALLKLNFGLYGKQEVSGILVF